MTNLEKIAADPDLQAKLAEQFVNDAYHEAPYWMDDAAEFADLFTRVASIPEAARLLAFMIGEPDLQVFLAEICAPDPDPEDLLIIDTDK